YLDYPDDLAENEEVTFLLNIHGGGSAGVWQRSYFPAHDNADAYRLVIAAPTAATAEPMRHWAADADDEHLGTSSRSSSSASVRPTSAPSGWSGTPKAA